jgi:hypothetical protein
MQIAFRQLLLLLVFLCVPVISWSANRLNILMIVGDDWGGLMRVLILAFTDVFYLVVLLKLPTLTLLHIKGCCLKTLM